jgi:phage tail tape-measure protein
MGSALLKIGLKLTTQDETTSGINSAMGKLKQLRHEAHRAHKAISEIEKTFGGFGGGFGGGMLGGMIGQSISEENSKEQNKVLKTTAQYTKDLKGSFSNFADGLETKVIPTSNYAEEGKQKGELFGQLAGLNIGLFIGSIVPFVGTIIGGMIGVWVGEKLGGVLGETIGEQIKKKEKHERVYDFEKMSMFEAKDYQKYEMNKRVTNRHSSMFGIGDNYRSIRDSIGRAFYSDYKTPEEVEIGKNFEQTKQYRQTDYNNYFRQNINALEYFQRN